MATTSSRCGTHTWRTADGLPAGDEKFGGGGTGSELDSGALGGGSDAGDVDAEGGLENRAKRFCRARSRCVRRGPRRHASPRSTTGRAAPPPHVVDRRPLRW